MKLPKKLAILLQSIVVLALIGAVGLAYYFYTQYRDASNTQLKNDKEVAVLKERVAKLLVLPVDEEPVIATVTDKSKLEQQDFFQSSENGDKVLIYQKAAKVVLYRPGLDKIVDVTSLNIANPQTSTEPVEKANVTIYNGTSEVGLAATLEKQLQSLVENITIVSKANATSIAYKQTLVIDISGKHSSKAQELASKLGVTVSTLPASETAPAADILIIGGIDRL